MSAERSLARTIGRFALVWLLGMASLELYFALRIASFRWINPASTAFERSSLYQNLRAGNPQWAQEWVNYEDISVSLKQAVIASEDDQFAQHKGVYWAALQRAWQKNSVAEKRAQAKSMQNKKVEPRIIGGSTITQQLAKNLFLSGERTYLRKAQELLLVGMLEALLPKERIYEIYLNHIELGSGIFGVQSAARHYFGKSAKELDAYQAARLAVLLPAPKRYQQSFAHSASQKSLALAVVARMQQVQIP